MSTNLSEVIDQHMVILTDIVDGKKPPANANATIALLNNLKQRVEPKCVALNLAQVE